MKTEAEFREGEMCLFEEDGAQSVCRIIKRSLKENGKVLSLTVEVLAEKGSGFLGAIEAGKTLDVWKRLDCWSPALWTIKEYSQQNLSHLS